MLCPMCGKENLDGIAQCQFCGMVFSQPQTVPTAYMPQNAATPAVQPVAQVPADSQPVMPPPPMPAAYVPSDKPTADNIPQPYSAQPQLSGDNVPEGVKGWSWAAFLWGWVWAVGNNIGGKTWLWLLVLIPIPFLGFGILILLMILFGIYGRGWAWGNNHWSSVDEFNRFQRNWVKSWLIVFGLTVILAIAVAVLSVTLGMGSYWNTLPLKK